MNATEIREFAEVANESERLAAAAEEFFARQDRRSHPEGWTDRAGRWYPSDAENAPLCASVRKPSFAYPWSIMLHCRTTTHLAELFDVDSDALKKLVTKIRREQRQAA
jgi:hypothetical protein